MKKIFKLLFFLNLAFFVAYLLYLNEQVKSVFSSSIDEDENTVYLEYPLETYPKELINMLLLVEDQSFYQHFGVDFIEIGRVLSTHLVDDKPLRGASTITQQLIKNTLLSSKQTLRRKVDEALMAMLMELYYDKNFILERYMNLSLIHISEPTRPY